MTRWHLIVRILLVLRMLLRLAQLMCEIVDLGGHEGSEMPVYHEEHREADYKVGHDHYHGHFSEAPRYPVDQVRKAREYGNFSEGSRSDL